MLIACAAAVYVAGSVYQWVDLDEGLYLGAALAVVHGGVPFVTFAAREPVLIYWLAVGTYLFGPSLLVGRLMVDVLFLIAGIGVFAAASRVEGRWAGIAAAGIFLFNPFDVYYGSIITVEAAVAAPLAWMLYLLFRDQRAGSLDLFFAGVLLGIGILTLRDSIILAPLIFLVVAWQNRNRLATCLLRLGAVSVGVLLTFGTVLLAFVRLTSLSWMWVEYGPGPGYLGHGQPLTLRLGALGYTAVLEPTLLTLLALVPGMLLMLSGHRWWGKRAGELAGLVMIALPWLAVTYFSYGTGDLLFYGVVVLTGLLLFSWFYGFRSLERADWSLSAGSAELLLLSFCLGWVALVIVVDGVVSASFFTHRTLELSVPASVGGGILLTRVLAPVAQPAPSDDPKSAREARTTVLGRQRAPRPSALATAVVLLLVGSSLFSAVAVLGPSNPYNEPLASSLSDENANQRVYSLDMVSQVASYVDANTPARSTVFTGDLAFITTADRPNLLNITVIVDLYDRPRPFDALPLGPDRTNLAPSWAQIFQKWNGTYVPMVVVGARTRSLELNFPYLSTYIASRYDMLQTFGNQLALSAVQVWALGRPPPSGSLSVSVPGPGTSSSFTAFSPRDDLVVASAWNSSAIDLFNGSTMVQCGSLLLPAGIAGVRSVGFNPETGQIWVAALSSHIVVENVETACATSQAFELNLAAAPTAFAFDPGLNAVLVVCRSTSTLYAFNESTGASIESFPVVASPAALSVSSSSNDAYVASGSTTVLGVYNASTGVEATVFKLGFEADNVYVNGSVLVVTWAATGLLEWLNATSGGVLASVGAGPQAEGFAVHGNILAVGSYGTGRVSFFDVANRTFVGSLLTGECPASLSFLATPRSFVLTGACSGSVDQWTLRPMVNLTVGNPGVGGSVTIGRLPVATPAHLRILPGQYSINVTGPGVSPQEFVLTFTADTVWSPSLGVSISAVRALQTLFEVSVTGGAVLIAALVLWFPPPARPATRPREDAV
ncbi:MAG: glycosyltransferase family 39 protein [Thermoplasmata archaeon]